MKLLVIAADAACPDYIFDKKELFPTICGLIDNGAHSEFSSYVQRGYNGSYSSKQNWASIYTGLAPSEHKIGAHHGVQVEMPYMRSFVGLRPLWEEVNKAGMTVSFWQGDCLDDPLPVDGYIVSGRYTPIFTPSEDREAKRTIQLSDESIRKYLDGDPPPRLYPKTLKQQGFEYKQLQNDPSLVGRVANEENFQPILDNFKDELEYWFGAMTRAQRERPTDVVWWFTPTTDILPHFTLWCDDNPVLIRAYQLLDEYMGRFIREFSPDNVVFMSDHGQKNFIENVRCSDRSVSYEAFRSRDKAVWLDNGYIALEALNGGLLFTTHSLKGVFIACGKDIRHTAVTDMRTLDIYPTLLELLGVKVPNGRKGYAADIFSRQEVNSEKILRAEDISYKQIALIQTHDVDTACVFLNELFLENRFSEITVVCEEKYLEIFGNNPRVSHAVSFEHFKKENYEQVFCGIYNEMSGVMRHIRIG